MKKSLIIILATLLIISLFYVLIVNSVRSNYKQVYNKCLSRLDTIKSSISSEEYNYPFEAEADQCINSGGCWEDCGSGCGFPEKPSWNPSKVTQQYLKNKRSTVCLAVCRQGCLYPI